MATKILHVCIDEGAKRRVELRYRKNEMGVPNIIMPGVLPEDLESTDYHTIILEDIVVANLETRDWVKGILMMLSDTMPQTGPLGR